MAFAGFSLVLIENSSNSISSSSKLTFRVNGNLKMETDFFTVLYPKN